MKIAAIVLLCCVALVASKAVELIPANILENAPQNTGCASVCLWSGIYNFPSFQNCGQYIHCIHGFQFQLECFPGEVFDHVSLRCQRPENGRCILDGVPEEVEPSA